MKDEYPIFKMLVFIFATFFLLAVTMIVEYKTDFLGTYVDEFKSKYNEKHSVVTKDNFPTGTFDSTLLDTPYMDNESWNDNDDWKNATSNEIEEIKISVGGEKFTKTNLKYDDIQYGFVYGNLNYGYVILPNSYVEIGKGAFKDDMNNEVRLDVKTMKKDFKTEVSAIKDNYAKKDYVFINTDVSYIEDGKVILSANYDDFTVIIYIIQDSLKDYLHICEYRKAPNNKSNSFDYDICYSNDYPQYSVDNINAYLSRHTDYQKEKENSYSSPSGFSPVTVSSAGANDYEYFYKYILNKYYK